MYVCKGWAIKLAPAPRPSTIYCAILKLKIVLTVSVRIQTFTVVTELLDIYEDLSSSNLFYKLALHTPMLCVHLPHKVSPDQSKANCNFIL
jgi:hypothetical protein